MVSVILFEQTDEFRRLVRRIDGLEDFHIYKTLADLKGALAEVDRPYTLLTPNGRVDYSYIQGDFSGKADNNNVVALTDVSLSTGALVKQGSHSITFQQLGVGSVPISLEDYGRQFVSPLQFGAVSGLLGDSTKNTQAFVLAIAEAARRGKPLDLNGETYILDGSNQPSGGVNFGKKGLVIRGGGATLRYVGGGRAFVADTNGADGEHVEGIVVDDLVIYGNINTTDGFYSRGVVRSVFRNIEINDVKEKAFHIKHGVSNYYEHLKYSPTSLTTTTQTPAVVHAQYGIYLTNNGTGYYTSNCLFVNSIMEDFAGTGCNIDDGSGNSFVSGTFEGCSVGLIVGVVCRDNNFTKIWMEANSSTDAVVYGNTTSFTGCRFLSASLNRNIQIENSARGTSFTAGGYIRSVDIAPGSMATSFVGVGVDENLSGTIGFIGTGPYTRIGCTKIDNVEKVSGLYPDIYGNSGNWIPTIVPATGTISKNNGLSNGSYERIGRLVVARCSVVVNTVTSPGGVVEITGLPFAASSTSAGSIHINHLDSGFTGTVQTRINSGSSIITIGKLLAGELTAIAESFKAGTIVDVTVSYFTNN